MIAHRVAALCGCVLILAASLCGQTPVKSDSILSYSRTSEGIDFQTRRGVLSVHFCGEAMVHVVFWLPEAVQYPRPWIAETDWPPVSFAVTEDTPKYISIATKRLRITAEVDSAALIYDDASGKRLVHESPSPTPRYLTSTSVDGEKTFQADAYFDLNQDEAIYGLGQHQSGLLNQRGTDLPLMQDNTNISIPFLLSSRGYGLLWNYASLGRYENHFQPKLALRAEVADAVDYYFIYGPEFDRIIAQYRSLTGSAPLLPQFAFGLWQSRWKYEDQQEFLDAAARYRSLHIPLDVLVLDANWMTRMGANEFTKEFPDPADMLGQLREQHVHSVLSEWPLYTPPGVNFDFMLANHYFVTAGRTQATMFDRGSRLFDAFNPDARATFWQQMKASLWDKGVDGWWLDASEPLDPWGEEQGAMLDGAHTALGSGSRYANMYPLFETKAVFEGQRSTTDKQRVVILTRSAFLGQQRNSAIAWSGDIYPSFQTLRRQVPAGLNYSMSGMPYWTTDIGGFLGGNPDDPSYQELYVRWFEYGTFCPIFRTHGARKANELWSYGQKAQEILTRYDNLRYHLLPYIYSIAWRTTSEGYTPMRALVMDFPSDRNALDISDQFFFGPALLVNPVTKARASSRTVYLPDGRVWYDFWTGAKQNGGRTVTAVAPLETIPLYVPAGSIIPIGPELQWTNQKPADPIELRIYPGRDAEFTLYEDDGMSYQFEKGERSTITFRWNDKTQTLSIGPRMGGFPQMLEQRSFAIVKVRRNRAVGENVVAAPDRLVHYDGTAQTIVLRPTASKARNGRGRP